ncbi:MAG TPA: preprotein translocase subunit SecE [Candidatus Saccharimonadales bacterium]
MPDEPAKKAKRLVKNPETFRERAIKASEDSDKPKRGTRLKQAGGKVTSPVFKPVGKASRTIFAFKPVSLVGKIILPVYVRRSWQELRQVTWPSWRESRRLTFAVLVFAIIFGASIALVDYGLDKIFRHILLK